MPRSMRQRRTVRRHGLRLKTPPLLYEKTQALVTRVEKRVGGTFLTYWTSTSGSVCDNDVMALHEILHTLKPRERVTLFVKSDGGSGMSSLRMVHLLRTYAQK